MAFDLITVLVGNGLFTARGTGSRLFNVFLLFFQAGTNAFGVNLYSLNCTILNSESKTAASCLR